MKTRFSRCVEISGVSIPERIDGLNCSDDGIPKAWKIHHVYRYRLAKRYCKKKTVIDAGCGYGYGSYILSCTAEYVVALDTDCKFRPKYRKANIDFIVASCSHVPIRKTAIDVVVLYETIEHLEDPYLAIEQARICLKNDGRLLVSTPNRKYSKGASRYHLIEFLPDDLINLVSRAGFGMISVSGQTFAAWPLNPFVILDRIFSWLTIVNCAIGYPLPRYSFIVQIMAKKRV